MGNTVTSNKSPLGNGRFVRITNTIPEDTVKSCHWVDSMDESVGNIGIIVGATDSGNANAVSTGAPIHCICGECKPNFDHWFYDSSWLTVLNDDQVDEETATKLRAVHQAIIDHETKNDADSDSDKVRDIVHCSETLIDPSPKQDSCSHELTTAKLEAHAAMLELLQLKVETLTSQVETLQRRLR